MSYEDENEYDDIIGRVGKRLDEVNRERSKAQGKCPECHGAGTVDCGGMEIGCSACDGTGVWSEPRAGE